MTLDQVIVSDSESVETNCVAVPWWSFTKTIIAAAALKLVGQGGLLLDAPIDDNNQYTLRHLLQHTSGLPDYGWLREYHAAVAARDDPWPESELLRRAKADELRFAPGTRFSYSNIGYLFVRRLIERTVNADLNDALQTLVFEPINIDGVFIATSVEDLAGTAWGNERRYHPGWVYHGLAVGSASAAASSLDGILRGPLLSDALKQQMLDGMPLDVRVLGRPVVSPAYGLGIMLDLQNPLGRVLGHTGQGPGSTSAVYSFPDLKSPTTLSAFAPVDGENAQGELERHVQALARER
jgi:CubicO group peptidase (beta-lactamase class C family)